MAYLVTTVYERGEFRCDAHPPINGRHYILVASGIHGYKEIHEKTARAAYRAARKACNRMDYLMARIINAPRRKEGA